MAFNFWVSMNAQLPYILTPFIHHVFEAGMNTRLYSNKISFDVITVPTTVQYILFTTIYKQFHLREHDRVKHTILPPSLSTKINATKIFSSLHMSQIVVNYRMMESVQWHSSAPTLKKPPQKRFDGCQELESQMYANGTSILSRMSDVSKIVHYMQNIYANSTER